MSISNKTIEQETKDLETFIPRGVDVMIGDKKVSIKPFVLRARTHVIRFATDIFEEVVTSRPGVEKEGDLQVITSLIETAGERLIEVYRLVLPLEIEEEWLLDNLTLKQEVELLRAINEVNDLPFVISQAYELLNKKVKVLKD